MSLLTLDMKGETCTFRTISPKDTQTYTGVISGIAVDADIASRYTDLVSYNSSVRTANPSVSTDLDKLTYFILSITNATGDVQKIAFAEEWIQDGSFKLLTTQVKRLFAIYSLPKTSAQDIIDLNRSAGYTIVEVTDAQS